MSEHSSEADPSTMDDQDAEPASEPTGAAAAEPDPDDPDAGPASEPQPDAAAD
jgi:hypothetical protein